MGSRIAEQLRCYGFVLTLALLATALVPGARAEDPPEFSWIRQFGSPVDEAAYGLASDGTGVYVAGKTDGTLPGQISAGTSDGFVRKYGFNGLEQWTRQFGTAAEDLAWSVASDGTSVYVHGYTRGALPGQTSAGGMDAFLRKYTPGGSEVWTAQYGTALEDDGIDVAVHATGVYVTGYTYGAFPGQTNSGRQDSFLRKYDFDGNALWTRQFGSTSWDVMTAAFVDDTGIYVAGFVSGALPGQTSYGDYDVYVRKYDLAGVEQWTDQFGTPLSDMPLSGLVADSSGVYVSGEVVRALPGQTWNGGVDSFLRKYDRVGTVLWTRQFGTSSHESVLDAAANESGVYLAGNTWGAFPGYASAGQSDVFVRKYDANGSEAWTRQFGTPGSDLPYSVALASGGLYLAGLVNGALPSQTVVGQQDAFAMKLGGTPAADALPTSFSFGGVPVGSTAFGNVTISSVGTAFLTVTGISLVSGGQGFSIANAPPTPLLLPPQDSVQVMISFTPVGPGAATDTLRISTNDRGRGVIDVPLTGTGIVVPRIHVTPGTLAFEPLELGQWTTDDVTIRSVGSGTLTVTSASLSGGSASFSIDAAPPTPLSILPGNAATIRIRFAPNSVGPQANTLRLDSNDAARPTVNVRLSGEGFVVPDVRLSLDALDFGNVELGTVASRTLSISSVGSGNATVTEVSLAAGTLGFEILAAPATPFVLLPGSSADVEFRFAATARGSAEDRLKLRTDVPSKGMLEVPLLAAGVDTTPPQIAHARPSSVRVGQSISIRAAVTDLGGVASVVLHYRGSGDADFRTVTMTEAEGMYRAEIPAQAQAGEIPYYIVARDVAGNEARDPRQASHVVGVTTGPIQETPDTAADVRLIAVFVVIAAILMASVVLVRRRGRSPKEPE